MTQRHCRVCGGWHDLSVSWPRACIGHYGERGPRSSLPSPILIRDQMDPLWHPTTGEYLDSKSEFRAVTKAHGGEEVGNDMQTDNRKYDECTADDIGRSIQMLNEGYQPGVSETATEGWS